MKRFVDEGLHALHGRAMSLVLDTSTPSPTILHWGAHVGDDLLSLREASERPILHGGLDVVAPLSLTPEQGSGYLDRPGLEGHRPDGRGWAPRFRLSTAVETEFGLRCVSVDDHEQLELTTEFQMPESGILRIKSGIRNLGESSYSVQALRVTLPLPGRAIDTLTFSGRWTNEFQVRRQVLRTGSLSVENRSGRTSHDRVPIAFVGTEAFTETIGEVWGVHLEWSGNSLVSIDASTDGRRSMQVSELLFSGEVVLATNEAYETPWVACVYSESGTNGASQSFHRELRSSPSHPKSARPVTLNIWEAVYFDHHLPTLLRLADRAAQIGVERYVVDDGWFHGRRNDNAGLGDWWVDESVWPDGLWPLANHVVSLGMQFGLWFEPEMVNPDSDLYRNHPDWVLSDHRYEPVYGRQQLVLNLADDDVRAYLFDKIDALLTTYPIAYVKWDMNRSLVHPSHHGRASVHAQTRALYRLLDDLNAAHPTVEIESCASGGGRIDFGMLRRTARVWTSDSNDALDRQSIQRGLSHFVPPEYMGAHIGPPRSHTTRRVHSLAFRAGTAFFGHLGIEWNILDATDEQVNSLADVIAAHKRFRHLLHTGNGFRLDHPDRAITAHSVVSIDQREALVSMAMVETASSLMIEPLRMVGLDDDVTYRIEWVPLVAPFIGSARRQPAWLVSGLTLSGRVLRTIGVQPPTIDPESTILLHLQAVPAAPDRVGAATPAR